MTVNTNAYEIFLIKDVSDLEENLTEQLTNLFIKYNEFYHRSISFETATNFLLARLSSKQSFLLLATDDNHENLLGFVQIYPLYNPLADVVTWILYDLYVSEQARRLGVATQLLKHIHALALKEKVFQVKLTTAISNQNAQRLYLNEGYQADTLQHYVLKSSAIFTSPTPPFIKFVKDQKELEKLAPQLKEIYKNAKLEDLYTTIDTGTNALLVTTNHEIRGLALLAKSHCSLTQKPILYIQELIYHSNDIAEKLLLAITVYVKANDFAEVSLSIDERSSLAGLLKSHSYIGINENWLDYYLALRSKN